MSDDRFLIEIEDEETGEYREVRVPTKRALWELRRDEEAERRAGC